LKSSAGDGRASDRNSSGRTGSNSSALSTCSSGLGTRWDVGWASVTIEGGSGSNGLTGGVELLGLSVDLLWLVVSDKVDLVGGSDWELQVLDGEGSAVLVLVGGQEGVGWWVGSHVGEVDIEGGWISVDGIPLDLVGLCEIPDGVHSWGGDLESKGAGGQCEEGDLRNHFEVFALLWFD
jgi:hypothetical protein